MKEAIIILSLSAVGLLLIWNIIVYMYRWPSGLTIHKAKKHLEENTHCGKYWNCKARLHLFDKKVSIYMEGNEYVELDLVTGKSYREDHDY